jgi:hypothetical protein
MKARIENGTIKIYKTLPSVWNNILNFRNASNEVLKSNGFYDVVKPAFNSLTQTKGGLYFDEANEVVTYDITDIDFDQDIDILDEEGNVTGTEKRYKLDEIKVSKLAEIKSKAGELLKPTDWQVVRQVERSIDIDADVATERAWILTEADRLEAEVNAFTSYADVLQYRIVFFPAEPEII